MPRSQDRKLNLARFPFQFRKCKNQAKEGSSSSHFVFLSQTFSVCNQQDKPIGVKQFSSIPLGCI